MRNLLLFFTALLLFTSCDELDSATPKEIKTINGYKIVGYYEIDGTDSVKVGERTFYPNSEKVYLEFRIKDDKLIQTPTFRPLGLRGRLYWFAVLPFHGFIFKGMLQKLTSNK